MIDSSVTDSLVEEAVCSVVVVEVLHDVVSVVCLVDFVNILYRTISTIRNINIRATERVSVSNIQRHL